MSMSDFFRTIDWSGTVRVAALRALAVAVVLTILMIWKAINGDDDAYILLPVVGFFAILFIAAPLSAIIGGVGRALDHIGLPFSWVFGLLALPFAFMSIIGDPLVWLLHKIKPEWVGVERFRFINPSFLFVFKQEIANPGQAPADKEDETLLSGGRRKYEDL